MTQQAISQILISLQQQFESPQTAVHEQKLIDLVDYLRPDQPHDPIEARSKFDCLIQALLQTPQSIIALQQYLLCLMTQYHQTKLYADSGILSLDGFWNQFGQRLGAHILPLLRDETDLRDLIGKIFHQPSDPQWLERIDDELWREFFKLLNNGYGSANEKTTIKNELIKAGVPADKIFEDFAGFRTLDSVLRAKEIFGQNSYIIISQRFHNERAVYLARKNNIEAWGYNAADVNKYAGLKTNAREKLARAKVFWDFMFGVEPKFGGEKILIP